MMENIVRKGYYSVHESFNTWEEAVRASVQPLIDSGAVKSAYADSIVESVKKYGPYIVIAPDIAIPHAEDQTNVNETTICFMKTNKPVVFDEDDRDKDAHLFFALASNDSNKHIENLAKLVSYLDNDEFVNKLQKATSRDEIGAILTSYMD